MASETGRFTSKWVGPNIEEVPKTKELLEKTLRYIANYTTITSHIHSIEQLELAVSDKVLTIKQRSDLAPTLTIFIDLEEVPVLVRELTRRYEKAKVK